MQRRSLSFRCSGLRDRPRNVIPGDRRRHRSRQPRPDRRTNAIVSGLVVDMVPHRRCRQEAVTPDARFCRKQRVGERRQVPARAYATRNSVSVEAQRRRALLIRARPLASASGLGGDQQSDQERHVSRIGRAPHDVRPRTCDLHRIKRDHGCGVTPAEGSPRAVGAAASLTTIRRVEGFFTAVDADGVDGAATSFRGRR